MTLALWGSKRVKFKRSLYITATVNQTGRVPGLQAEGAKRGLCVWFCLDIFVGSVNQEPAVLIRSDGSVVKIQV